MPLLEKDGLSISEGPSWAIFIHFYFTLVALQPYFKVTQTLCGPEIILEDFTVPSLKILP